MIVVGDIDTIIDYYNPMFMLTCLLLMGMIKYLMNHETLSTCYHVGRHVDFSLLLYFFKSSLCPLEGLV